VEWAKIALMKPYSSQFLYICRGRARKPEENTTIEKLMGRYKFF
jgi:hypothetical protein